MVGGCTDERQTERDVNGMIERKRLDGDQRLIVIHAQSNVVSRACPFMKERVGGKRSDSIDSFAA